MTVGVLKVVLVLPDSRSLKDKRRTLQSVKDRLGRHFNVSVSEVDALDSWQRAVLGVALVANDGRFVHRCLARLVAWFGKQRLLTLVDYSTDMCWS